jgi:hypothetical protein
MPISAHGVIFTPEAHWKLAMMLRRQAITAPTETERQELERLAGISAIWSSPLTSALQRRAGA